MQRCQVDLLRGNELVLRIASEVLDEVDEERIVECVLSEKDNVGALGCEITYDRLAYTARTTLR